MESPSVEDTAFGRRARL